MKKKVSVLNYQLRIIIPMILVFFAENSVAQPFGNEWIDYNQSYYKIQTALTGFYRISYNDLINAGVPIQNVDPRKIQLFFRGSEMAIEVAGQLDARFDPQDYIVFYGQKNDGTLDANLYIEKAAQPHAYYNLFSDTAAYFLTWRLDNINGKRVASFFENNVGNLPAENYYLQNNLILQTQNYSAGRTYPEGSDGFAQLTEFDFGEGWTGGRIGIDQSADFVFKNLSDLYLSGEKPVLEVLLLGRNNRRHKVEILAGNSLSSLRSLGEVEFNYYNTKKFNGFLEWSDISTNQEVFVRVKVKGYNDGIPDFASVSYVTVSVPRQFKIAKDTLHLMDLKSNMNGKSFIQINNALASFSIYDVTDPYSPIKIGFNHAAGTTTAIIANTFDVRRIAVHNNKYLSATLKKVEFKSFDPSQADYLILSHKDLMRPSTNLSDPVKAFADYRASTEGGNMKALVAEINQLYDQFSYGEQTPLAIRRFCNFMVTNGQPKFLFIIGRGLDITYNYHRQNLQLFLHKSFIPPAGYPAADINFSAGLGNTTYEPAIPTGRITAKTPNDVENYLNKIKEMESLPHNELWRKDLVHLSGGLSAAELFLFNRYVTDFKNLAEGNFLGGKATIISKKSNYSTELINISDEVNKGKMMVTFFGHSGSTNTDVEIGYVSDDGFGYRNKGKYPLFLINGCNAGHIFSTAHTFGEDWMLTPNRGAIGFLASVSLGYSGYLKRYSDHFYSVAFADSLFLNLSMGEIQKEVSKRYMMDVDPTPLHITQTQQMLLQGDPYYNVFKPEKPDFSISDTDVLLKAFNGNKVTALTDSFAVGAIVKNLGRATIQSLKISVERTTENGSTITYEPQVFSSVKYLDTLWFTIQKGDFEGFGKNYFTVFVDFGNEVDESNENNNAATFSYFIPLNSPRNISPIEYAIVNNKSVVLIAQTSHLLGDARDFIVEIDTSANFTSSYKKQWTINGKVLIKKQMDLLDIDSTVYYWRTRFADPLPEEDNGWSSSSFAYIKDGHEGWGQLKFPQIDQNSIQGMVKAPDKPKYNFIETENEVIVKTYGPNHPELNHLDVELTINGLPYVFSARSCSNNSINLVAFDKATTVPYLGIEFPGYNDADRRSCGRVPQLVNNFLNNEIESPSTDYLTKYIDNVPEGDYILLFSIGSVTYQNWPETVKNKLMSIGVSADVFTKLQNGYPLIVLGKKGSPAGSAVEVLPDISSVTPPLQQELNLNHVIKGNYSSGSISSQIIGPALEWSKLFAKVTFSNIPVNDQISFDVIGVNSNGSETLLLTDLNEAEVDISNISVQDYPYLKLSYHVKDAVNFTPAQLRHWIVQYSQAPEGVLLPFEDESFSYKKQEGENFTINLLFENISNKDFQDSVTVQFSNYNVNLRDFAQNELKIPAVKAHSSEQISVNMNTLNKVGKNNLKVEANPKILPEQYYFNNFLSVDEYLGVEKDLTNPLLEVLVDGRYIIDRDIVSPSPLILIRLKDENKHLYKTDTSGIEILLKQECDDCFFKRISFSDPNLKWIPAGPKQDFQVEYQSEKLENGVYILQVQATDATGNSSGSNPFRVRFEVVNETTISNFFPYPNPFSSSTRFVFTLTGEVPDKIKIQIMTVSGRIVREITQDELGPIRIGHNMTTFAWDGKDYFGDQLANGVYLYKVEVQKNGQSLDQRATVGDRAFKKGFGKLYILR